MGLKRRCVRELTKSVLSWDAVFLVTLRDVCVDIIVALKLPLRLTITTKFISFNFICKRYWLIFFFYVNTSRKPYCCSMYCQYYRIQSFYFTELFYVTLPTLKYDIHFFTMVYGLKKNQIWNLTYLGRLCFHTSHTA